ILQARNADCYVKSLFHEIHETIIQVDVEDDVRMLLGKINQRLADRRVRKSPGCGEFDAAAYVPGGIANALREVVDFLNDFGCALEIGVARFGQGKLTRRAIEQE